MLSLFVFVLSCAVFGQSLSPSHIKVPSPDQVSSLLNIPSYFNSWESDQNIVANTLNSMFDSRVGTYLTQFGRYPDIFVGVFNDNRALLGLCDLLSACEFVKKIIIKESGFEIVFDDSSVVLSQKFIRTVFQYSQCSFVCKEEWLTDIFLRLKTISSNLKIDDSEIGDAICIVSEVLFSSKIDLDAHLQGKRFISEFCFDSLDFGVFAAWYLKEHCKDNSNLKDVYRKSIVPMFNTCFHFGSQEDKYKILRDVKEVFNTESCCMIS